MTGAVESLVAGIRAALQSRADPVRAESMRVYMKSTMPFFGVPAPVLRSVVRPLIAAQPLPRQEWELAVRVLFDRATHREERYAALEVAGHRSYRAFRDGAALGLFEHLVVSGAWWDLVDATAGLVGEALRADPDAVRPAVWAWATADSLWLRRVANIAQLKAREATDLGLLSHAIGANLVGSRYGQEFFIRKAIGWALRQYAYTDPAWVRAFVDECSEPLSGLSRREALKHLGPGR